MAKTHITPANIAEQSFKTCKLCRSEKPITEFYRDHNTYSYKCKSCARKYRHDRYWNSRQRKRKPGRPRVTRICVTCGNLFTCWASRVLTACSVKCIKRKPNRKPENWIQVECARCGVIFERAKYYKKKYCSAICSRAETVRNIKHFKPFPKIPRRCKQCDTEFIQKNTGYRGRFCSRPCMLAYKKANAYTANVSCETCGIEFIAKLTSVKGRFCSLRCAGKWRSLNFVGPTHPNWKGGYEPYYGPSWIRAKAATRKRDKVCQDCGITPKENGRALDVHHILPFRLFGRDRHNEANNLSNLVALCPSCHSKRDKEFRRTESLTS